MAKGTKIEVVLGVDNTALNAGMVDASKTVQSNISKIETSTKNMGSAFKSVAGNVGAFFGVFAAGQVAMKAFGFALEEIQKSWRAANIQAVAAKEVNEAAIGTFVKEKVKLDSLMKAVNDSNTSVGNRKKAIGELIQQFPEYYGNLDKDLATNKELNDAYKKQIPLLLLKAKAQAASNLYTKALEEQLILQTKVDAHNNKPKGGTSRGYGLSVSNAYDEHALAQAKKGTAAFEALMNDFNAQVNATENATFAQQERKKDERARKKDQAETDRQNKSAQHTIDAYNKSKQDITRAIETAEANAIANELERQLALFELQAKYEKEDFAKRTGVTKAEINRYYNAIDKETTRRKAEFINKHANSTRVRPGMSPTDNPTDPKIQTIPSDGLYSTENARKTEANIASTITAIEKLQMKFRGVSSDGKALGQALTSSFQNMANSIGESIGESIAHNESLSKNIGKTFLRAMAAFMKQLGSAMIAVGQLTAKFREALLENPYLAAALGVALVAAGSYLNATLNEGPKPQGFATGGIVDGAFYTGDKVPIMANAGEMVLNESQQSNLFKMLNGGGQNKQMNLSATAFVDGKQLAILVQNSQKDLGRG